MAGRVTRNILNAVLGGANDALKNRLAREEEQRLYDLQRLRAIEEDERAYGVRRSRALEEGKLNRALQLQYGEEDYNIGRGREASLYNLQRSRALEEDKLKRALQLQYGEEDYNIKTKREDAKRRERVDLSKAISEALNDPSYISLAMQKIYDLPMTGSDGRALIGGSRFGRAGGSGALGGDRDLVAQLKEISGMIERYQKMIITGYGTDFNNKPIELDESMKLALEGDVAYLRQIQTQYMMALMGIEQGSDARDVVSGIRGETRRALLGERPAQPPEPTLTTKTGVQKKLAAKRKQAATPGSALLSRQLVGALK